MKKIRIMANCQMFLRSALLLSRISCMCSGNTGTCHVVAIIIKQGGWSWLLPSHKNDLRWLLSSDLLVTNRAHLPSGQLSCRRKEMKTNYWISIKTPLCTCNILSRGNISRSLKRRVRLELQC